MQISLDTNIAQTETDNVQQQFTNYQDYDETTALVLIGDRSSLPDNASDNVNTQTLQDDQVNTKSPGIDLPGFVSKKSRIIKHSLKLKQTQSTSDSEPIAVLVKPVDIENSLQAARQHWISLYGNPPPETVVAAAMPWLARDIWLHTEGCESELFTWSRANLNMNKLCSAWRSQNPTFERVIVVAGVLEDPFATNTLAQRMPTLIRRFVNSFKRSHNVTSFETLESTMTVHGALKILGLPTLAGASLTLGRIRESYKSKAFEAHPDSGGTTDGMRRINEAYQLLKELYRQKN